MEAGDVVAQEDVLPLVLLLILYMSEILFLQNFIEKHISIILSFLISSYVRKIAVKTISASFMYLEAKFIGLIIIEK